jgi:hypothetical protein
LDRRIQFFTPFEKLQRVCHPRKVKIDPRRLGGGLLAPEGAATRPYPLSPCLRMLKRTTVFGIKDVFSIPALVVHGERIKRAQELAVRLTTDYLHLDRRIVVWVCDCLEGV